MLVLAANDINLLLCLYFPHFHITRADSKVGGTVTWVEGGPLAGGGAVLYSDVEVAEVKAGVTDEVFQAVQEQSFL